MQNSSIPRGRRVAPGGLVYHVLNRGVTRLALFEKDAEYEAFERVLVQAMQAFSNTLLVVLPDAESLAYGHLAAKGWRIDRLSALADSHACDALARA
jgi:hypothetical protein